MLEIDLSVLKKKEIENADENQHFIQYLKSLDADFLDEKVGYLNQNITPSIDCTQCGNCCKTLMINVENEEADQLAAHLKINRTKERSEHMVSLVVTNRTFWT